LTASGWSRKTQEVGGLRQEIRIPGWARVGALCKLHKVACYINKCRAVPILFIVVSNIELLQYQAKGI
jgi:hypothetical protein